MAALYAVFGSLYIWAIGAFRPRSNAIPIAVPIALCIAYAWIKSKRGDPRARSVPIEIVLYVVYSFALTALWLRILPSRAASGDVFTGLAMLGAALMHFLAVVAGSALGVAIALWRLRRQREPR